MDIYISYKREYSADLANNLSYRLSSDGFDVFYDVESMGRGDYRTQIYSNIDKAKDVLVIIHPKSFENVGRDIEDWFIIEVEYAISKSKNIIPVLTVGADMGILRESLPVEIKPLAFLNAPDFSLSSINRYINILKEKYLTSAPSHIFTNAERCTINFYSDVDCAIYLKGVVVGNVLANANDPLQVNLGKFGQFIFEATSIKGVKRFQISVDDHEEVIYQIKFCKQKRKIAVSTIVFAALWILTLPFAIFNRPATQNNLSIASAKLYTHGFEQPLISNPESDTIKDSLAIIMNTSSPQFIDE